MRFFTVPDARAARSSVFYATGLIGYFYILTFVIGFAAISMVGADPAYVTWPARLSAAATWWPSIWPMRSAATC